MHHTASTHRLLLAMLAAFATLLFGPPALAKGDAGLRGGEIDWPTNDVLGSALDPDQELALFVQFDGPPAAATWLASRSSPQSRAVASQRARQRLQEIEQAHGRAEPAIRALGGKPLYRLSRLANAIAVNVRARDIPAVAQLPGVIRVERVPLHHLHHASSVSLIQAPQLWAPAPAPGLTGAGMRIGIIDSGVDYLHTGFGGSGLPADYAANNGTNGVGFPNAKVIGGRDFVGDSYNADDPALSVPMPDNDPMDCNGHGSHVAGTAAGFGVNPDGSTFAGPWDEVTDFEGLRIAPGVAPEAQIYALRVFGCSGTTAVLVQAIEWATDPDGDGDFSDRLDVINMSLGSPFGSNSVVDSQATNLAGQLGIVIAASAGNSGDFFYNSGLPGAADWAISTASSVDAASRLDGMPINAPASIGGQIAASRSRNFPWAGDAVTADVYYPATNRGACATFSIAESVAIVGKIILVDWTFAGSNDECGSPQRSDRVQAAGGVGAIMVLPDPTIGVSLIAGNATLPAVSTNSVTGDIIKQALLADTVNVTLTDAFPGASTTVHPGLVDTLSTFSSRGPRADNVLKPDLTAPGQTIWSIASGTGVQGASFSGTSMAAPHVAGAAALLRQLRPDWSVPEIKALLMNTASVPTQTTAGITYSASRQGAGRMALADAAKARIVASDDEFPERVSLSFGALLVGGQATFTRSVRVVNKGATAAEFALSIEPFTAVGGASVATTVPSVVVEANDEATFDVVITADAALLARVRDATTAATLSGHARHYLSELSGRILLTPTAGAETPLRVSYHASLRPHATHSQVGRTLWFGKDDVRSLMTQGEAPLSGDYLPLAWALQLQATSPAIAGLDPERAAADLKYVGVGSAPGPDGTINANTPVYFAVATHSPWSVPLFSGPGVEIYIDSDRDGVDDFILFNAMLTNAGDVFVSAQLNLVGGATDAIQFLNDFSGAVSSEPHNSSVMVLVAYAGTLGLAPGSSRFDYRVRSYHRGKLIDKSPLLTYDVAAPALNAGAGSDVITKGRPRHVADGGATIDVTRNPDALDDPLGLLMIYHLNDHATQAQILPMRTHSVSLSPSGAGQAGTPGSEVFRAFVVTNTGNDTDTYDVSAVGQWNVSVMPATVTLEPGESAPVMVSAIVPADSSPGDLDVIAVDVTSQENAAATAAATFQASSSASTVRAVGIAGSVARGGIAGASVVYGFTVTNAGNATDSFSASIGSASWTVGVAPAAIGPLSPGANETIEVTVQIPADAVVGSTDDVTLTLTSAASAQATASTTLTTTVQSLRVFADGFEN
jgi:subtilisin family serine protease